MTLELIVFVAAILFGILLYWRESNGNGAYRFINKIVNSKALQMKAEDKTGFVYKQKFILRLVYVTSLFLILMIILKFLIPINYTTISIFASCIVGTLIGTYVANFVLKSGKVIEEKGDSFEDIVTDTIDKGKELFQDLTSKDEPEEVIESKPEILEKTDDEMKEEKSARDRLKDKGYL
jgi:hypothetical protein